MNDRFYITQIKLYIEGNDVTFEAHLTDGVAVKIYTVRTTNG